ncbi:hypothetical protein QZH41_012500 [Actinostola sp. cb2023]|nr:hypothetical protein QZH41_012500 [Actinostola sp. cb2023]
MRKTVDVHKSLDIKRHFSSDDDDDDKNEYNDFKRKKYNKDECYWTTSGDDSDDNRGKRNYRNERKNESSNYSKRRHSRDYSSDSDDDRRQRRKHNHCKYQRRSERSPHRSRSPHRGNSSNSEDETHRRRRRHRHHRTHDKKSSPHKESSKESNVHLYDIENERKKNFKLDRTIKETSTEKRKIVYIGNIDKTMTKSDVWTIFRKFGPIEKTTVHYRDDGDSYSFVTFVDPSSALEAIEEGKSDPKLKHLDICFGGRRRYCGGSYVDFDSTTSCLEEQQEKEGRRKSSHSNEAMDFDALLQMCLKKNK